MEWSEKPNPYQGFHALATRNRQSGKYEVNMVTNVFWHNGELWCVICGQVFAFDENLIVYGQKPLFCGPLEFPELPE